jgi:N-acetyl-gamma-glutamyl-phosphate reductase
MKKVAIVGAHGFTGRELARLLLQHPYVELSAIFSRDEKWCLADDLPEAIAEEIPCYSLDELSACAASIDILFLATPADISIQYVQQFNGVIPYIIDLSGAYRLSAAVYSVWYQSIHQDALGLEQAQFGLVPWNKNINATTYLIANPGCYATCALMALLPLLKQRLIHPEGIVIDAKSGVSGAGRTLKSHLLFNELDSDFYPYRIGQHQHTPEIERYLALYADCNATPILTTQLLPVKRGIAMSIYSDLVENSDVAGDKIDDAIYCAYDSAYQDYPLARFISLQQVEATSAQRFLSLKRVVGSSRIHIAYKIIQQKLIVFANIDNLLKGAASQAIENMNQVLHLPVTTALDGCEGTL